MISFKYDSHRIDMGIDKPVKCPMNDVPSLNIRLTGAVTPPRKSYTSNHTIAPAYNKGGYQVISKDCIKDIGR